jgi:hypothetical protein
MLLGAGMLLESLECPELLPIRYPAPISKGGRARAIQRRRAGFFSMGVLFLVVLVGGFLLRRRLLLDKAPLPTKDCLAFTGARFSLRG